MALTDQQLNEFKERFFGLADLPIHYYEAFKELANQAYRKGFMDGHCEAQVSQQMPDPFMEVAGG